MLIKTECHLPISAPFVEYKGNFEIDVINERQQCGMHKHKKKKNLFHLCSEKKVNYSIIILFCAVVAVYAEVVSWT